MPMHARGTASRRRIYIYMHRAGEYIYICIVQESSAAEAAGTMAMLLDVEEKADAAARGAAARHAAQAD
jgi:hypothetical protein